jgi:polyisoprenoid-binding protein YceI
MKKVLSIAIAALAVLSMSFAIIGDVTYKVNQSASSVTWKGYKVTGSHEGKIAIRNGQFTFNDKGALTGGNIEIEMNNMTCTDLSGEYADKLVGHLKADDFFGTEKFKTSKLVVTKAAPQDTKGNYKVTANLTIKDVTKEVKFFANVADANGTKTTTGKLTIDRGDFGIKYGSGSFFDGLGDKTIYDEFDLTFNVVAVK